MAEVAITFCALASETLLLQINLAFFVEKKKRVGVLPIISTAS
jgi:hypothetical protein